RIRTTEVTFDSASNGGLAGPQVKTWIHGYWSTGSDNVRGRLRYVVNPEGVVRHSGSSASGGVHTNNIPTTEDPDDSFPGMDDGPYLSCGLDSASDDALIGVAASVYNDYDAAGNVTDMTKGCGSCGSGHYTYSYGPCSGFPTTEDQDFNQAVRYIRQTTPTGLRVVEFQNAQGFLLFRVEQETTVAGTRRWTTHYKYDKDKNGRLKETRMPSACEAAGYNHTEGSGSDAGWPTAVAPSESGTEGLVYLKGFIDEEGPDKFPEYTWQAVRHGTNSGGTTLYTSVTAYFKFTESLRRDLVKATYEFPGAVTANPLTIGMRAMDELLENPNYTGLIARTGYAYTFYTPSPVIRTETITRQAVSPGNHGSGSGGIVRRYYHRDGERGVRYWNQWTQHEDGTCTRTEQNDYGQTSYTIEDADTAALPTDLNWSARSGGLNLTTNYTYDDAGRIYKVIANGIPSQTAYLSCRQTGADDIIMTTRLVTLHAPFDGVNYALLPLQISVTDVGGHTTVAATGKPTSATDGDLCDDWASGAPGDGVDPSGNVN
ncbi:MAG: hypothetical protein NT031_12185, partial [Planctomycetota bacterium]|nr:hypothetical protein [Planctomycetota bacterium]